VSSGTGGGGWQDSLINLVGTALRSGAIFRRLRWLVGMILIFLVLVIVAFVVVVIVRGDDFARIVVSWIGETPRAPT
jgi:hypothetical protein